MSSQSVFRTPYSGVILLLHLLTFPTHVLPLPQTQITTRTVTSPPSTPSNSPQYTSELLFTSAILNSTNTFRVQHSAANVTYNTTLSSFASAYLASVQGSCTFAHSGGPYGENLALGYPDVAAAVDAWGDERADYDWARPGFSDQTGHFTQLVWKNTTAVGCGRVECGGGKGWYLVCEYWPRGNVEGEFGEMVGRPIKGVEIGNGGAEVVGLRRSLCVVVAVAAGLFVC